MRLMVATLGGRISPVLDVARRFVLVDATEGEETGRREVWVDNTRMVARARRIAGEGAKVLICGAVSRPLEALLVAAGIRIVPNTCGMVDEVVEAFLSGRFTEEKFLMPGCCGKRRRDGLRRDA